MSARPVGRHDVKPAWTSGTHNTRCSTQGCHIPLARDCVVTGADKESRLPPPTVASSHLEDGIRKDAVLQALSVAEPDRHVLFPRRCDNRLSVRAGGIHHVDVPVPVEKTLKGDLT